MPITVGSFPKSTNTGVPVAQVIAHGLGVIPKALIMWQSGESALAGWQASWPYNNIGFTDQDRNSLYIGTGSNGGAAANADCASGIGAYAIAFTHQTGGTAAFVAGTITAWDDTNFTITWTANHNKATIIGFIAIGGASVQSKAILHALDGDTGADPIIGAGFEPDLAFLANIGNVTAALPVNVAHAKFGLGVTNGIDQWGIAYEATDALPITDTKSVQRTDNCLISLSTTDNELAYTWLGSILSMDSDGLTLDVSIAGTAASHLAVLFLKGVRGEIGAFNKDSSGVDPTTDSISSLAFTPEAVILAATKQLADAGILGQATYGFGASMETAEYSSYIEDVNDVTNTDGEAINSNTKGLTLGSSTETTVDECDVDIQPNAFDVIWTINSTVASQILYLALDSSAFVTPVITDIQPREFANNDLVEITGTGFKAAQGAGKVELGDNHQHNLADLVEQNIDHWEDLVIRFITNKGSLPPGQVFVFVTNDDGETNDPPAPGDPGDLGTILLGVQIPGTGSVGFSIEYRLEQIYAAVAGHAAPQVARDIHFLMSRIGQARGINLTSGYRSLEDNLILLYQDLTGNTWPGSKSAELILGAIEAEL